jgi:tetratricopeptide (TPR) repeat protein
MLQGGDLERMKWWRLAVVAAVFSVALVRPALGAQADEDDEADKAAAKAHYEAATRLYDVHDYAKALEEYKAAYLAKPDPAFLFNMGQCYKKLGRPAEALGFYRDYLKKAPAGDPYRASIEARVRELEAGDVFEGERARRPAVPLAPAAPSPSAPAPAMPAPASAPVYTPITAPGPAAPAPPPAAAPPATPPALDLTAPGQPASAEEPLYGKWWLWTGVGALVVAGTVTAIVLATSGSTTNTADTALGTRGVFQ